MALLPRFTLLSQLNGFSAWLMISLAAHGAFFGWLAGHTQLSTGHSKAMLQVSLVSTGNDGAVTAGQVSEPRLRTVASSRPTPSLPQAAPPITELSATVPSPPPSISVAPLAAAVVAPLPLSSSAAMTIAAAGSESSPHDRGPAATPGALSGVTPMGGRAGLIAGSGGDTLREEARLAHQSRPEYPPGALAQGWDGQVLLRLRVNTDGNVQQVRVERSSGYEVLDQAALRAARNWLFFPAREAGVPVMAEVKVPVVFARESR